MLTSSLTDSFYRFGDTCGLFSMRQAADSGLVEVFPTEDIIRMVRLAMVIDQTMNFKISCSFLTLNTISHTSTQTGMRRTCLVG